MVSKKEGDSRPVKRYVITSAQASYSEKVDKKSGETQKVRKDTVAELNRPLRDNLERYCKDHDAELVVLGMRGKDAREKIMHESLEGIAIYNGTKPLNNNIRLSNMVVPPQNVDPATGRSRVAQINETMVFPHSKQRVKAVVASNVNLPRLLVTTGAITHPNYRSSNHRGDMALRDHTYGAVVVEIIDKEKYNIRNIKALKGGGFIDMGRKYTDGKRSVKANTEALVLGDLHVGEEDPQTMAANYEMMDFFKPKRLFIHDLFNGSSVNPHEKDNLMTRAKQWNEGKLNLEKELKACNSELKRLGKKMGKRDIYIVASNHNFFLDRYLESGKFLSQPWNLEVSLELAKRKCKGEDPVEAGIAMMGKLPSNIHFLGLNDDMKVWGYQLASHGHKGNSGARAGNAASRELAHGKSITGHTHTPELLRGTIIVGTSTILNPEYTEGSASSWMAANAVLYEGGLVQLLPIINGKWKAKDF
jgi:hypothetical protein